ncbi:MAG: 3-oxoacyl-[acyl-carrier-protein] synthase III C-terminal domain-containing protein [Bdellovibrionota bacterium]|nr:3-oxoacyl-[acyl-carrier-protein] synthase III C-terminal domain-containing protein [Bdellovibrionota bacterium]
MDVSCGFSILGSGSYLPENAISAALIAEKMNVSVKWVLGKTGVETRYFAENETIASMAAKAVNKALENAGMIASDIDLLIAAGGTPDQPIPHNSALIHKELDFPNTVTPLDVDATCMSFIQATKIAASLLENKIYKNIVVVSAEKPSVGLDYNWPESAALLGDGAVAFIFGSSEKSSGMLFSEFTTINEGVHLAEIPAGGTRIPPKGIDSTHSDQFLFKMEGQKIYKLASKYLPDFFENVFNKQKCSFDDFKMVVPHQASLMGLGLMRRKLGIPKEKYYINVQNYGNLVAASVPMALHELLHDKKVQKGDDIMLACTAAGLTLGVLGLRL